MSDFSTKTQFDYLYDALASKFPGIKNADGRNTMFQFSQMPVSANWANGNDAIAYNIANSVSKNLDGFYVHGDALDVSYSHLIKTVKPKSGDDNERYRHLLQRIVAENNKLLDIRNRAYSDYYVWRDINSNPSTGVAYKSFNEWLDDDFGGAKWQKDMDHQNELLADLCKEQTSILDAMDAALADAIKRLESDQMSISANGQMVQKVPKVTIDGNLPGDYSRWLSVPKGNYDFDVNINASQTTTAPWVTVHETKIERSCFKTSITHTVNTSRIVQDKFYNLNFKAVGLNSYNITRGLWYSPDFVKPDIPLAQGAAVNNDYFFGAAGVLHMIPNNVLVIYKPEIELTISTQTYKETLGKYANLNIDWIEMFGVRMRLGTSNKLEPVDKGDKQVIKINSPENAIPSIIGLTSSVVYNGK